MKRHPEELRRMMGRFEDVVRGAGIKLTHQRLEIFREAARTEDHPDIETIFKSVRKKMPTVSLDTVYRALGLFAKLGLVTTVRPLQARVRYDANMDAHHHFICTRCGAILDFKHADFDAMNVPKAAKALGRVESRHVELRGLCVSCQRNDADSTPPPASKSIHRPRRKFHE